MGLQQCFQNLMQNPVDRKSFFKDGYTFEVFGQKVTLPSFKDWLREKYKSGEVGEGYPANWNNANRQINRMIAFYEGTGSQARSGRRALEYGSWMAEAMQEYFNEAIDNIARQCLGMQGYGFKQDKPTGGIGKHLVGDVDDLSEYESEGATWRYRQIEYTDFGGAMFKAAELAGAGVPAVAVVCCRELYVLDS